MRAVAIPFRDQSKLVVIDHHRSHQIQQRFVEADVDLVSDSAVPLAGKKGCQHGVGSRHGGNLIGNRKLWKRRGSVGLTSHVGKAAECLGKRSKSRAAAVGTGLPITAHVKHNQSAVLGAQRFVCEPPFRESAGAKILDQNIGGFREPPQDFRAARLANVDRNQFLVS